MSGRVLNFGEFFDKYSKGNSQELGLDAIIQSQSNFEEGFDDETYDQKPIGPRRPVTGDYEETPAGPDTSTFAPDATDDSMEAPEEIEAVEADDETEEIETAGEEESEEAEEEESEEEESEEDDDESEEAEEDDDESDDVPEPEAGANPKLDESLELRSFSSFIGEAYHNRYSEMDQEYGDNYEEGDYYDEQVCPGCGKDIEYSEMGANCGCNP
jgi:hypothetical protein